MFVGLLSIIVLHMCYAILLSFIVSVQDVLNPFPQLSSANTSLKSIHRNTGVGSATQGSLINVREMNLCGCVCVSVSVMMSHCCWSYPRLLWKCSWVITC